MTYRQITSEQRYMLAALRTQGSCAAEIARQRGCHRSAVGRELRRNRTPWDGHYRASKAQELCNGRRSRSPRNQQFSVQDLQKVGESLVERWSPEQISGRLATAATLSISHETICRHVWRDKKAGGTLYTHLRCAQKRRRKGYGHYDSRGRLAGKRHISERPAAASSRRELGHWEIDTVMHRELGRAQDRPAHRRQTRQPHNAGAECPDHRADERALRPFHHHYRRQWHRVSRLRFDRSSNRNHFLFRYALPLVAARHKREHQRPSSAVPAARNKHVAAYAAAVHPDCSLHQCTPKKTPRLSNPSGVLL